MPPAVVPVVMQVHQMLDAMVRKMPECLAQVVRVLVMILVPNLRPTGRSLPAPDRPSSVDKRCRKVLAASPNPDQRLPLVVVA